MQDVLTAATVVKVHPLTKPVLLHITHHWGGGTEQHVQEITDYLSDAANHLVLHSRADGLVILSIPDRPDRLYHPVHEFVDLASELRRLGVTRVHVHQLFTVPIDVRRLIEVLHVTFDFTVHDYHIFCPRVHFKTRDNAYCGEPDAAGCATCLQDWNITDERDVVAYRDRYSWIYREARYVICPTCDVAARVERYVPGARIVVASHLRPVTVHPAVSAARLAPSEPLNVAVLGWVTAFKGADRVLGAARIAADAHLPLRIQVIGTIDGDAPPGFNISGAYASKNLRRLLVEARPHLLWYAAQVPETYSYILSEGLEAGLPVLVPRLGAFPERVSCRSWSWIVDWNLSPAQAVNTLMTVREHFVSGIAPPAPIHHATSAARIAPNFYRTAYLDGAT